jgi:hypothetical protein
MVFFAGLPGTGKSLLVHQLAHLASRDGRIVHLLQWDVARPVFEASPAGRRYPLADGVTHPVVRRAAGLWVRRALVAWHERHPEPGHVLIGETPFVGGRFVELARRLDGPSETLLTNASCRFVIAVPSPDVRHFLEFERERRAANPLHPRERDDAPPHVLRELWRELTAIAGRMGISAPGDYDPSTHRQVYERVLRHRNVEVAALEVILPTEHLSVYDFAVAPCDLVPTTTEAEACIHEAENRYPDLAVLEAEISRWWEV